MNNVGVLVDVAGSEDGVIVDIDSNQWHWTVDATLLESDDRPLLVVFELNGSVAEIYDVIDDDIARIIPIGSGRRVLSGSGDDDVELETRKNGIRFRISDGDWVQLGLIEDVFRPVFLPEGVTSNQIVHGGIHRFDYLVVEHEQKQGVVIVPTSNDLNLSFTAVLEECGAKLVAEKEREEQASAIRRYQSAFASDDIFVNPYNFVPLPTKVHRVEPIPQHVLGSGRHMGRIELKWKARTPLLFGSGTGDSRKGLEHDSQSKYRVAGSSLKGAISALHEALTGSCLRVTDLDFVPVYREPASVHKGRHLGVITRTDQFGRPSEVLECGGTRWVEAKQLHRSRPAAVLRTGDVFEIGGAKTEEKHGRTEFTTIESIKFKSTVDVLTQVSALTSINSATAAKSEDHWIALLSDGAARRADHPYHVALGSLIGDRIGVANDAHDLWEKEVAGSDDLRTANANGDGVARNLVSVNLGRSHVGNRVTVPRQLQVGDIIWIEVDDSSTGGREVVRFSISNLWRTTGIGAVHQRISPDAKTCECARDGSLKLCMSCRLFGFIDESDAERREAARQESIRGLVSVSHLSIDLSTSGFDSLETRTLPPRGAPRPGSGQFYLDSGDRVLRETDTKHLPASAWGAKIEGKEYRRIRGRKFYWHADPVEVGDSRWSRANVRQHQTAHAGMGGQNVQLVPAGSTVTATVTFENLSDVELGSLLAALDPDRAIGVRRPTVRFLADEDGEPRPLRTHLGGGKPLGFGSVELEEMRVTIAENRYSDIQADDGELTAVEIESKIETFVSWLLADSGEDKADVNHRLAALAAMLDPDRVNPERVAYPPAKDWSAIKDQAGQREFDASFTFFTWSRGGGRGENLRDLYALPQPTANPWLKIDPDDVERGGR